MRSLHHQAPVPSPIFCLPQCLHAWASKSASAATHPQHYALYPYCPCNTCRLTHISKTASCTQASHVHSRFNIQVYIICRIKCIQQGGAAQHHRAGVQALFREDSCGVEGGNDRRSAKATYLRELYNQRSGHQHTHTHLHMHITHPSPPPQILTPPQ